MTDSIGRADYELGADLTGLHNKLAEAKRDVAASAQNVEETYKSAAYRAGEAIGTILNRGTRLLATAASGVLAIATKGTLELSDAQAKYRAETGATVLDHVRQIRADHARLGRRFRRRAAAAALGVSKSTIDAILSGRNWREGQVAQALAEYAVLLALVIIVVIAALVLLGQQISAALSSVGTSV